MATSCDMANKLMVERDTSAEGINWHDRFITCQEDLDVRSIILSSHDKLITVGKRE
jgi:hypothetical protein